MTDKNNSSSFLLKKIDNQRLSEVRNELAKEAKSGSNKRKIHLIIDRDQPSEEDNNNNNNAMNIGVINRGDLSFDIDELKNKRKEILREDGMDFKDEDQREKAGYTDSWMTEHDKRREILERQPNYILIKLIAGYATAPVEALYVADDLLSITRREEYMRQKQKLQLEESKSTFSNLKRDEKNLIDDIKKLKSAQDIIATKINGLEAIETSFLSNMNEYYEAEELLKFEYSVNCLLYVCKVNQTQAAEYVKIGNVIVEKNFLPFTSNNKAVVPKSGNDSADKLPPLKFEHYPFLGHLENIVTSYILEERMSNAFKPLPEYNNKINLSEKNMLIGKRHLKAFIESNFDSSLMLTLSQIRETIESNNGLYKDILTFKEFALQNIGSDDENVIKIINVPLALNLIIYKILYHLFIENQLKDSDKLTDNLITGLLESVNNIILIAPLSDADEKNIANNVLKNIVSVSTKIYETVSPLYNEHKNTSEKAYESMLYNFPRFLFYIAPFTSVSDALLKAVNDNLVPNSNPERLTPLGEAHAYDLRKMGLNDPNNQKGLWNDYSYGNGYFKIATSDIYDILRLRTDTSSRITSEQETVYLSAARTNRDGVIKKLQEVFNKYGGDIHEKSSISDNNNNNNNNNDNNNNTNTKNVLVKYGTALLNSIISEINEIFNPQNNSNNKINKNDTTYTAKMALSDGLSNPFTTSDQNKNSYSLLIDIISFHLKKEAIFAERDIKLKTDMKTKITDRLLKHGQVNFDDNDSLNYPYTHRASYVMKPENSGVVPLIPALVAAMDTALNDIIQYVPNLTEEIPTNILAKVLQEHFSLRGAYANLVSLIMDKKAIIHPKFYYQESSRREIKLQKMEVIDTLRSFEIRRKMSIPPEWSDKRLRNVTSKLTVEDVFEVTLRPVPIKTKPSAYTYGGNKYAEEELGIMFS